jgi:hypothetical protein
LIISVPAAYRNSLKSRKRFAYNGRNLREEKRLCLCIALTHSTIVTVTDESN